MEGNKKHTGKLVIDESKNTLGKILKDYFNNRFFDQDLDLPIKTTNADVNFITKSTQDDTKFSYYTFDRFIRDIVRLENYSDQKILFKEDVLENLDKEVTGYRDWDNVYRLDVGYSSNLRYHCSPYKLVDKLYLSESEKKIALYKLLGSIGYDFKIVSGEDIRYWYLEANYLESKGDLGGSCMRYYSCQSYFDIYTTNPQVELAILYSENKLLARCLFWDKKYIDRRYGISTKEEEILYSKLQAEYPDAKDIWTKQSDKRGDLELTLDCIEFDEYPFMDTFLFADDKTLHNNENWNIDKSFGHTTGECKPNSDCYHYESVAGEGDNNMIECHCCDCEVHIDDSFTCEENGNRYCENCIYQCEYSNNYYSRNYVFKCYISDNWYNNDYEVHLYNGEPVYEGLVTVSDVDDEYYEKSDISYYTLPNGIGYHCTEDQYNTLYEDYMDNNTEEDKDEVIVDVNQLKLFEETV